MPPQKAPVRLMLMAHEPDVVDAGKKLRGFIADRRKWADVRPYLDECVFALANETAPASAGAGYKLATKR
ncbi:MULTISPECIES: hypothetical protein [unclassified Pseudomonas]|uniref:hypothetical protein n=1 Tax=unclassified Pseudomonas TaxID=196821 RepID=UPI0030DAB876